MSADNKKVVSNENLAAFAEALAAKVPLKSDIPTKVSDLQNDLGFTDNPGTITSVTLNGTTTSSGGVDLGYLVVQEGGKGLSSNDYTAVEKNKLGGIDTGAQVNTIESVKVNGTALIPDANKAVNVSVPTALSDLSDDSTHRLVSDTEKTTWSGKQDALTFDTVPTQNSTNPVTSGGLYTVITQNELTAATALNDLNDRVSDLEEVQVPEVDQYPTEDSTNAVSSGGVYKVITDNEYAVSLALSDLNSRISSPDQVPTEDSSNLISSGAVYSAIVENEEVAAAALSSLDSRVSSLEDDLPKNISDLNDDIGIATISNFVSKTEYEEDSEVVAAAVNELNTRVSNVEDGLDNIVIPTKVSDLQNDSGFTSNTGTLTGVSFNGVDASVSNGVASIVPYHIDLNGKYLYITLNGSCVLQIITTYHGQYENCSVIHLINVDVNGDNISVNPICLGGSDGSCFELYPFMYQNGQFLPVGINDGRSSGGDLILTIRIYNDEEDPNATKSADITVLGGTPPLSYTISNTIIQLHDYSWEILSSSITGISYSATDHKLYRYNSDGSRTQVFTASSIVSDGGGLTGVSFNGSPATVTNNVASISADIPTESTVSGWGFTKNAGTLTGVSFNGTSATVSNGVASISANVPLIIDVGENPTTAPSGTFAQCQSAILANRVVALMVRDDEDDNRYLYIHQDTGTYYGSRFVDIKFYRVSENYIYYYILSPSENLTYARKQIGTLTGVKFNNVDATVSNGVASITASIPDVANYFDEVAYDSQTKRINFKHGETVKKYIDATDFIKDGMVDSVEIATPESGTNAGVSCLVVTFNTDAGKEDIEIPLSSIFNPSNYYTKTETDSTFVKEADIDSVPTENSDNPVSSGGVYTTIAQSEYVISTSLNDLNTRVSGIEDGLDSIEDSISNIPEAPIEIINVGTIGFNSDNEATLLSGTYNNALTAYNSGKTVILKGSTGTGGGLDVYYTLDLFGDGNNFYFVNSYDNQKAILMSSDKLWISGQIDSDETDPIFSASPAAGITASDITGWNNKVSNVQSDWNATTGLGVILNKPTIPAAVTESTVSGWGFTKNTGTYSKPSGGIPASDLTTAVQTSLGKADTALQSFTETDPVFSASAAAGITSSDITNWNGKTSNTGTITGINMNGASKGTSGVVDLGTVITSHATHKLTASNGTATAVNQGTEITYVESLTGTNTATSGDLTVSTTRKKVTIPTAVTESTVSGWGFTKNAGTLTGVKVNGSNATVTSGVADIGTVITSETQLSKGTTSGSGNAVTDISVSNHQITLTKGSTFLTSHQSIKTINNQTITGTGNVTLNTLPTVSASDNGKILMVVNGAWTLVSPVTIYSGSGEPNNSMGNNGDIYLQT